MSSIPFFETEQLGASFRAALVAALDQGRLSEVEAAWLAQSEDAKVPASMIVEMVLNAHPLPGATLMIGYSDRLRPWTYVFDPLQGLHIHDSRDAAQIALQAPLRQLGLPGQRLDFIALESAVFDQWSRRLMHTQLADIERMSALLGALPGLRTTMNQCVQAALEALLPTTSERHRHPLQIINASTGVPVATSSLGKVALQMLSHEAEGFGLQRRYLNESRTPQSSEHSGAWEQALGMAIRALPEAYSAALHSYWSTQPVDTDMSRSEHIALALADGYARALLHAQRVGLLDTAQLAWMRNALLPTDEPSPSLCLLTFTYEDSITPLPYAGLLVIRAQADSEAPVYIFSAAAGIRRFRHEAALKAFFLEVLAQPNRPQGLSIAHWPLLHAARNPAVILAPLASQPFQAMARSLADLLQHNLAQALREPGAQSSTAIARLDDALDIRALVDRRLSPLDNAGRWPLAVPGNAGRLIAFQKQATDLPSRIRQLQAIGQRYATLRGLQPSITQCIEALLAPRLAMITDAQLRPGDIQLQYDGITTSLVDFFLRRLARIGLGQVVVGVSVLDANGKPLVWPDAAWLLDQVDELKETFAHDYKQHLLAFETGCIRLGQGVVDVREETQAILEALLRADLAAARDSAGINALLLELLEGVLNHSPAVHIVQSQMFLRLAADDTRVAVSNAFALSASADPDSAVLQWTPFSGLRTFSHQAGLQQAVDHTLVSAVDLRDWATLLAPSASAQLLGQSVAAAEPAQPARLQLETLAGDLITQLLQSSHAHRAQQIVQDLSNAIRCRFDAVLLRRFMAARNDPLGIALRESLETLVNQRFNDYLPTWLQAASRADLWIYQSLLERCAQLATPNLSYLQGIPEMEDFARDQLKTALAADNPAYPDDSDQISITLTHFDGGLVLPGQLPSGIAAATSTVTKTLTEFSLTHFSEFSSASMAVRVNVPDKKVPGAGYLRALVSRLDIATPYRQILADAFSPHDRLYPARRRLFGMALQSNLLACTCQASLQRQLSPTAAYFVTTVLTSPDALARQPVEGLVVGFSQLQLKAAAHLPPDPVNGMYVIGPVAPGQGPLILYTAYQNEHILQEFKHQADLLHHLHSDKRLEALVIDSVSDDVRVRYANHGLLNPHVINSSSDLYDIEQPFGPAQLMLGTISGNALHCLFKNTLDTLLSRASARTVTRAEAKWKAWRELLKLGMQEAAVLIPSELSALVNLWQSIDWLQASAQAASQRKWGEALAEFTTALATLALSRDPNARTALDRSVGAPHKAVDPVAESAPVPAPLPANNLAGLDHTQRLQQHFEAQDVELGNMVLDRSRQVFHMLEAQTTYAAVQGKVYEVREVDRQWFIFKAQEHGPRIRLRSDGQWEFYLSLRGGADHGAELDSERIERDIPRVFTVQAEGMAQVYQNHYGHYLQIQTARTLSIHLLSTALSNLNAWRPWEPLPIRIRAILESTFGEPASALVLGRLREDCKTLLKELLSPAMSPHTSPRIVTGYNVPGRDFHLAFTYRGDPKKRIFLSELFFKVPDDVRMNSLARDSDLLAHHQATTLIHELSHATLKTEDIVYVDAIVPDLAVLEQETYSNQTFYNRVKNAWDKGFTAATPPDTLFTIQDSLGTRDLRNKDGTAKAAILRLTGRTTLAEAREDFHSDPKKRAELILANADSLTLLISRLGQSTSLASSE